MLTTKRRAGKSENKYLNIKGIFYKYEDRSNGLKLNKYITVGQTRLRAVHTGEQTSVGFGSDPVIFFHIASFLSCCQITFINLQLI